MNMINLTPHAVRIFSEDGKTELAAVNPSGAVARVSVVRKPATATPVFLYTEIPAFVSEYGAVVGLPEPDGATWYIVSAMVRQAVPTRRDVLSPGELVRGADGQPIGCRGLDSNV